MTFYSDKYQIGDRVSWRREVYRMPYAKRPIDTGTVVANRDGYLSVRDDTTGQIVRGSAVVFSLFAAEDPTETDPYHGIFSGDFEQIDGDEVYTAWKTAPISVENRNLSRAWSK